ncbi:MAG: ATP-binding cassette domain-containing protein [Betaproteobacteria bacterium]|nr:ATP-binding cassette domain-containing protein [Betaproteobacteria bacterium]
MFELTGVEKRHGDSLAVAVASWRAEAGEAWLLAGPSGSSKSTVLHLIAALTQPTAGRIVVANQGPRDARSRRTRPVARAHDRARAATAAPDRRGERRGQPAARAALASAERDDAHPRAARGGAGGRPRAPVAGRALAGQAQRVAVARAVVNRPAVLLADEPTAALDDDEHAAVALELLRAQAIESGATLVVASHDARVKPLLPARSRSPRTCARGGGRRDAVGLAFAYARRRPLATTLVVALAAIGIAIATLTLIVSSEIEGRLARDARGIDLVVGAKGSPLQLVLAGAYHADVPPGNIPYASLAALRANPNRERHPARDGRQLPRVPHRRHRAGARRALRRDARVRRDVRPADAGSDRQRGGRATGLAVSAAFAGAHGLAEGGGARGQKRTRSSACWCRPGRRRPAGADPGGKRLGRATFIIRRARARRTRGWPAPPRPKGGGEAIAPDGHAKARNGRAANGNGHAKPRDGHAGNGDGRAKSGSGAAGAGEPDRELTMILVRYASPIAAASLPREINQSSALVAASPAYETARLFTVFGVGLDLVRAFAAILVGASVLLLFVALAQALEERRYDLAILRALGARRRDVVWVLMAESVSLAAAGAVLGLALGHLAAATIGSWLPAAAPRRRGMALRACRRRRRGSRDRRRYTCRVLASVARIAARCRGDAGGRLKP